MSAFKVKVTSTQNKKAVKKLSFVIVCACMGVWVKVKDMHTLNRKAASNQYVHFRMLECSETWKWSQTNLHYLAMPITTKSEHSHFKFP